MEKRNCRNCKHFNPRDNTCEVGGHSDIGNPDKVRTKENCNAWKSVEKNT